MEKLKIDINSWHFWLASFLSSKNEVLSERNNLCAYTRGVMWGTFRLFLILAVCVAAITPIIVYGTHFFAHWWDTKFISICGSIVVAYIIIAAIIIGVVFGCDYADQRKEARREAIWAAQQAGTWVEPAAPEPTVLVRMYRSWKEKHCCKIEFGN